MSGPARGQRQARAPCRTSDRSQASAAGHPGAWDRCTCAPGSFLEYHLHHLGNFLAGLCLVVTLTTQPGLRSAKVSGCSTNPVFPSSVGRANFTILESGFSRIITALVVPF